MTDEQHQHDPHQVRQYMEFSEDDPRFQIRILGLRVDALTKEKEALEVSERNLEIRIAAMERLVQRGVGSMIVIPIIGALIGFLLAYGRVIFAPWTGGGK